MTRSFRLALLSALATFALIVLGGLSRTRTGPGCDDWPRCQGQWLPPADPALLVDWLHRAVSASIGLLLLATAVSVTLAAGASAATRRAAWSAVALLVAQSLVGALTVGDPSPAWAGTVHLGLAIALFGATVLTALSAAADRGAPAWMASALAADPADARLRRAGALAAGATFLLLLSGAASNAAGVAFACTTWPVCPEGLHGSAGVAATDGGGFVLTMLATTAIAGFIAWQASRIASPAARAIAAGAVAVVGLQAAGGAAALLGGHPDWIGPVYLGTLTPLLALAIGLGFAPVVASPRLSAAGMGAAGGSFPVAMPATEPALAAPPAVSDIVGIVRDYVALTKPGIMTLLLTTTLGAMLIAEAGLPPFWLVLATLVGGVLSSGGANVLNCYIDRDIDAVMSRTRNRASAAGRISPNRILAWGVFLTVLAVVQLWVTVNPLASMLALSGNLFYVFVYTLWLKRRTPQNIVIGGAAGAVPPLVGWAAVTGDLSVLAWGLFAIIFLWTPPHFWSLALLKQGEYGRVGVPMLPNVAGEAETRKQILVYTVALFALCVALTPFGLGWIYLASAVAINGAFLVYALRLYLNPSKATARGMFFYSLWYLALIYAAAVIDRFVLA